MLIYFSFSFLASFPCLSFMYLAVLYIYSALFLASFLFLYFFFSLLNSFCLIIHRLSSYSLRLFLFVTFCTYLLFLLLSFRFLFVVFFTSPFLYSFVQLLSSLPYQRRSKHWKSSVPQSVTPNTSRARLWGTYWDITLDKANSLGTCKTERFHELSSFKVICDNGRVTGEMRCALPVQKSYTFPVQSG
jgi:hypothetical protein